MKTWIVALTSILASVLPAMAQTTVPAEVTSYIGEIVGQNVYVRAGASTNDYFCTKLSAPATVTVVGEKNGWLEIKPAAGCFSAVDKQYVALDADGKTGTITGDHVWYRSAGDGRNVGDLGAFWRLQKQMRKGDKVQVLGSGSNYYNIATPEGGTFWISGQYVRPQGGAAVTLAARKEDPGQATTGLKLPTSGPAVAVTSRPASIVNSQAQASLESAEKMLFAEFDKPAEQRDIKGLLAAYQGIKPEGDSYVQSAVDLRLGFLNGEIARMKAFDEIRRQMQTTMDLVKKSEQERANNQIQATTVSIKPEFAAKGILSESALFGGGSGVAKRFMLHNPGGREINGYAQSASPDLDLAQYIGKHVGLMGAARFDRALRAMLVEVQSVAILDENGELPVPPKPFIKPLPPRKDSVSEEAPADVDAAPASTPEPAVTSAASPATKLPPTGLPMANTATAPANVPSSEYK